MPALAVTYDDLDAAARIVAEPCALDRTLSAMPAWSANRAPTIAPHLAAATDDWRRHARRLDDLADHAHGALRATSASLRTVDEEVRARMDALGPRRDGIPR